MATYDEVLTRLDDIKPNSYSREQKMRWLNDLEQQIKANVIDTHEDPPEGIEDISFSKEQAISDQGGKTLLVPDAYDELYIHYLEAKVDYYNREFERYNNSNAMYTAVYAEYTNWYNRTHRPKTKGNVYF